LQRRATKLILQPNDLATKAAY